DLLSLPHIVSSAGYIARKKRRNCHEGGPPGTTQTDRSAATDRRSAQTRPPTLRCARRPSGKCRPVPRLRVCGPTNDRKDEYTMKTTARRSWMGWRRPAASREKGASRRFRPEISSLEGRQLLSTFTLDSAGNLWQSSGSSGTRIVDTGVTS